MCSVCLCECMVCVSGLCVDVWVGVDVVAEARGTREVGGCGGGMGEGKRGWSKEAWRPCPLLSICAGCGSGSSVPASFVSSIKRVAPGGEINSEWDVMAFGGWPIVRLRMWCDRVGPVRKLGHEYSSNRPL